MTRYIATFGVSLSDVGLARSIALSVARNVSTTTIGNVSTTTIGNVSLQVNGRTVAAATTATVVQVVGTAAQLDEIAVKLRAAGLSFKQQRELHTSNR